MAFHTNGRGFSSKVSGVIFPCIGHFSGKFTPWIPFFTTSGSAVNTGIVIGSPDVCVQALSQPMQRPLRDSRTWVCSPMRNSTNRQGCACRSYRPGKKAEGGALTCFGHTDRPLNLPTKTLKADGHGVPGGENMMVRSDGSMRYFMFRESASLRTFPEGEGFHG